MNIKSGRTDYLLCEKARRAAQRQLEAIEALPGAILREVFDFEEENTGS